MSPPPPPSVSGLPSISSSGIHTLANSVVPLAEPAPVVVDRHPFGVGRRVEHPDLVGALDAARAEREVPGQAAGAVELAAVQPPARAVPGDGGLEVVHAPGAALGG